MKRNKNPKPAMQTKELAPAKVNLCLHIVGQREDGYHLLDSIVAFSDFGDELTFTSNRKLTLLIDGPFGDDLPLDEGNLILRTANIIAADLKAQIKLIKNLPIASGIGGGSSDAAATMRGCARFQKTKVATELAIKIGADVPVCLQNVTQRMQGIGEVIEPFEALPLLNSILVNSGDQVETAGIFEELKFKSGAEIENIPSKKLNYSEAIAWLRKQRNDLESPAIKCVPNIGKVLKCLKNSGADLARMSGSGATCFGLYESEESAEYAAQLIRKSHPSWWVKTTKLG